MYQNHKLATCCYCGHRTVLALGGTVARHELACASCGAPLHQMKALRKDTTGDRDAGTGTRPRNAAGPGPARPAKRRKKKRAGRRLFDFLEDAAEEIFDIFD